MSKLIDYVVKDHANLNQKKIAFKFPNVSADLLSVNNDKVFNFFSKKGENDSLKYLDRLTDCLDSVNHKKYHLILVSSCHTVKTSTRKFRSSTLRLQLSNHPIQLLSVKSTILEEATFTRSLIIFSHPTQKLSRLTYLNGLKSRDH